MFQIGGYAYDLETRTGNHATALRIHTTTLGAAPRASLRQRRIPAGCTATLWPHTFARFLSLFVNSRLVDYCDVMYIT